MEYSVYDIIYRNDMTVRRMLEEDLLYLKTGFLSLRDADGQFWYLFKREGLLVPERQEDFDRTYGIRDASPKVRKINVGEIECECDLPTEECAKDFFTGLNKISACADWKVGRQLWKISSASPALYDAPIRMVRPEQFLDRVSTLSCVYVKDPGTGRRNFTNFEGWEYIAAHEVGADGKITTLCADLAEVTEENIVPSAPSEGNGKISEKLGESVIFAENFEEHRVPSEESVQSEIAPETSKESEKTAEERVQDGIAPETSEESEKSVEESNQSEIAPETSEESEETAEESVQSEIAPETSEENEETAEESIHSAIVPETSEENGDFSAPSEENTNSPMVSGQDTVSPETPLQETETLVNIDEDLIRDLLDCDKRRCRLESYEEDILYDIKRGHWDLADSPKEVKVSEKGRLVPRNPKMDIKTGIVGIDFGTKSTVVVRQDDTSAIIPIRIGAEVLSAELRENDYENPTIIECTDLDEFIRKYQEQEGRPETSCDDFFVSYDAYSNYRSCPPNEFYAYYADLKQWANHEKENVVIRDKQKQEYRFGADTSDRQKIINPIELYAYYIGMYINNMRNGIYMKYLMSFPVGYSKETRQLIVSSFEKGIKKSLPQCILEDEECMKDFSVRLGISEPAAYAVTALEMSELEPEDENDRYRYGIFDFGGGTADFGFGIWRGASEEEYEVEGYDYVLECFGADSDVTLGGEKILEMLAYAVFKKNRGLARRKKITCSLPFGERPFLGSETLISDSQIARRNMSILKEELRPLWHQEKNWETRYRHGAEANGNDEEYIEPALYDIDGNKLTDCRFAIDTNGLISLIKARIQKGIDAFFKCMSKAFQKENMLADPDGQMYIFLAGNSSKSIFVKELFEETIREYSAKLGSSCFKLVEPLNEEDRDEYVPNAKTSVAYGLIKSREGSSIKVEKNFETDAEEQTRFKYYLGRERRRHFDCRLSPVETEYGSWIRFQGAARQTVRIYYTTNPTADVREEPPMIDSIPYREITIAPRAEAFIFLRTVDPTVIEYTVACSEETAGAESEVCRIDFGM